MGQREGEIPPVLYRKTRNQLGMRQRPAWVLVLLPVSDCHDPLPAKWRVRLLSPRAENSHGMSRRNLPGLRRSRNVHAIKMHATNLLSIPKGFVASLQASLSSWKTDFQGRGYRCRVRGVRKNSSSPLTLPLCFGEHLLRLADPSHDGVDVKGERKAGAKEVH